MKKVIMALVMMASVSAYAGQEQQAGKVEGCRMVTETVYDGGESGVDKRVVTYKLCPSQGIPNQVEICGHGELYPCTPTNFGIPGWLQHLNDWAASHGLRAPEFPGYEAP